MPALARPARLERCAPFLVALAAALVLAPVLGNGWVRWDDDLFIVGNPGIRSFSAENLRRMATAFVGGTYQPLGWLSYALDFKLWGLDPRGFHLTSLLVHALNAGLVYALILRLLRLGRGARAAGPAGAAAAAFGALTFALHPLRVESVAWAGERRQVLAVALVLAAVLAYLEAARSRPGRRRAWLAASLVLLGLSATAKAWAITAPLVLAALDWYPLRRRAWLEKIPFLVVGAGAAAAGYLAQARTSAVWSLNDYPFSMRLAQAGYGLVFYARKTLLPFSLSPLYAVPEGFNPGEPRFVASWAVVLAFTAFAWRQRQRRPGWLTAWLCYVALLLPVLGLAQSGSQFVADRYSDLACVGWSALAAAGWLQAAESRRRLRAGAFCAGGAALLALGVAARRQTAVWRDPISLWSRAVEVEPWSPIARVNLGASFARSGRPGEAAQQYATLLATDPNCMGPRARLDQACREARFNYLAARGELGDLDATIKGLRQWLSEEPGNALVRKNLEHALELKASPGR